jgi:signal transduction histidine kinase
MPRRRPPPLVADSLLALVLAVASLALIDSGTSVEQGPVSRIDWSLAPPPKHTPAGYVWSAQIVVLRDGEPGTPPGNTPPVLTVLNTSTGDWSTTAAKPTGVPGFYRARVLFRDAGEHTYSVLLRDGGSTVPVDKPTPPDVAGADRSGDTPGGLVVLTLLAALPIALRRRHPLPVLAITLAAALTADVAFANFVFAGPLVALYSVGAHVGRPTSLVAAAGTAVALPLLLFGKDSVGFWEMLGVYAGFAAVWLLGDNVRTRRERSGRLQAERQANVRRAAAEEQARMARELHDIIGHSVSVMTIQAAAAGDAFDSRPAQVREALRAIESTGRETLAELRRLLAGVRPDESGVFAPAPGLEGLDALAERVRGAGLAVELTVERGPEPLPPSIDLSAYRIVQEALTNTLKHANATTARVDVRQTAGTLEIDVVDDGKGAETVTPGHGIIGMRERAALFGGHLSAGPAPAGGFAVRARIPVAEPVP